MKRLLSPFLLLLLLTIGCQPKEVQYTRYHNERFGFELDYPSFMTKDPAPENGDGIRCHGKGLEIVAYGDLDIDNGNINLTFNLSFHQGQVDEAVIEHIVESYIYKTPNY